MIRNSDMTPSRASPHIPAEFENFPKTRRTCTITNICKKWKHAITEAWYFPHTNLPHRNVTLNYVCVRMLYKSHTWLNWYKMSNIIVTFTKQQSSYERSSKHPVMLNNISIVSCKCHQMLYNFEFIYRIVRFFTGN